MAVGPGKYDDLCTYVRITSRARGALLILIDGADGTGFSCQADPSITMSLPEILEEVAAQIRRDGPFAGRPQ